MACAAALLVGCSLALNADIGGDADLQLQLGTLLYDETRYQEALVAFTEATKSDDARVAVSARKGTVRTALKVAEFMSCPPGSGSACASWQRTISETLTLHADALWSAGLFDEAEREYRARRGADARIGARAVWSRAVAGGDQPVWTRRSMPR